MEYEDQFEQDFVVRTQRLLEEYSGPYDATLRVNCLLGLLVVPRAISFNRIPSDPVADLDQWGISQKATKSFGRRRKCDSHDPNSVRGVVQSLRNAVAHFRLTPKYEKGQVCAFRFQDDNDFDAILSLEEIRAFTTELAAFLNYSSPQDRRNAPSEA